MKRFFIIFLTFVLVFMVSACGPKDEENNNTGDSGNTGDTSADTGGDTGGDTGNTGGDTGDTGGDTGNTGGDTGNTGNTGEETCGPGVLKSEWETEEWKKGDIDNDGIPNGSECSECPCPDTDGDGMPDYMDTDSDGDGIPDSEECPEQPCRDTDGDGMPDYIDRDSDNDGLSDKKEKELGTDPYNKDTDGDGSDDLAEIAYGSDPLDDNDTIPAGIFYVVLPYQAPDDVTRTLTFSTKVEAIDVLIVFDDSGSMGSAIENLKKEAKTKIIDAIANHFTSPGFAAYGLVMLGWEKPYAVYQPITNEPELVKTAIDKLKGSQANELHTQAMYLAATGEEYFATLQMCMPAAFGGCNQTYIGPAVYSVAKADCTGQLGSVGGACFRKKTMPIYIVISDERYDDCIAYTPTPPNNIDCIHTQGAPQITVEMTIAAMNGIGAKFIGIDSGFDDNGKPTNDPEKFYTLFSEMTGSLDGTGKNFNSHTANADGSGMSDQIAQAIIDLTTFIDMDVTTGKMSDEDCYGASAADFVKSSKTIAADPPEGVSGQDETTFFSVTQGTDVTFDVRFHNDFCINNTDSYLKFNAQVTVLGNGSYLSSRLVTVIVPEGDNK
jgi:hypothetical protein